MFELHDTSCHKQGSNPRKLQVSNLPVCVFIRLHHEPRVPALDNCSEQNYVILYYYIPSCKKAGLYSPDVLARANKNFHARRRSHQHAYTFIFISHVCAGKDSGRNEMLSVQISHIRPGPQFAFVLTHFARALTLSTLFFFPGSARMQVLNFTLA